MRNVHIGDYVEFNARRWARVNFVEWTSNDRVAFVFGDTGRHTIQVPPVDPDELVTVRVAKFRV